MANSSRSSSFLLFAFLLFGLVVPQNAPEIPPSPTPDVVADSPPPLAPSPFEFSPENSPAMSPPAPPPAYFSPDSSPADSPELPLTPSPAPGEASDVSEKDRSDAGNQSKVEHSGMNGGKKAGIVVGVIVAVCLVGLGGFMYKKRLDNIRRSQYGFAARRESL